MKQQKPWVMDLPKHVILNAAHACYSLAYADVYEERWKEGLGSGELTSLVDKIDDEFHMPIMWRYIGRIEQAWGNSLFLVFHHMGVADDDRTMTHALTDLLLGCMGHGVSLADDFQSHLDKAAEILKFDSDPSPIDFEDMEWHELAEFFCPKPDDDY